jgi:hypothetical protein
MATTPPARACNGDEADAPLEPCGPALQPERSAWADRRKPLYRCVTRLQIGLGSLESIRVYNAGSASGTEPGRSDPQMLHKPDPGRIGWSSTRLLEGGDISN